MIELTSINDLLPTCFMENTPQKHAHFSVCALFFYLIDYRNDKYILINAKIILLFFLFSFLWTHCLRFNRMRVCQKKIDFVSNISKTWIRFAIGKRQIRKRESWWWVRQWKNRLTRFNRMVGVECNYCH